jgi:hypothetical protein
MRSLALNQAIAYRLQMSHLLNPAPARDLIGVVGAVCGIQAQILMAAEIDLAVRVEGLGVADLRAEIWDLHRLVKTYGPRNTLHLLPAHELPLWMAAMRARTSLMHPNWYEPAGLDARQAGALLEAIGAVLDGRALTREELASEVASRAGSWARERLASTWGELLSPAAYHGLLCFGPSRGSKVTFVRADLWAGGWQELDPEESLREVLRRYLAAYGPAAHSDFARWFWLQPEHARDLIAALAASGDLEEVRVEGKSGWMSPAAVEVAAALPDEPPASLHLLPQYDCYVLGSGLRDTVIPEPARKRIGTYGRGRYEGAAGVPTLLVNGVVSGIWERKLTTRLLKVKVEPFAPLSALQEEQLEAEAARLAAFFGVELSFAVGTLA